MRRSLMARLLIGTIIILVGLALTFALDRSPSFALGALPEESNTTMGRSGDLFYAGDINENGRLYLSRDGIGWLEVPASFEGQLRAVALAGEDNNVVYAATEQALYVTTNRGQSWERIVALDGTVVDLALDPTSQDGVYALSEHGTLSRLSNRGQQLETVTEQALPHPAHALVVDPMSPQTLFVATDGGLFRSETAGLNWERIETLGAADRLLASSTVPHTLYATTPDSGLFRSTDGGFNWESINEGLGAQPGTSLAVTALTEDPARPGTLYAATAYVTGHTERRMTPAGLFMSPDGGTQWIMMTTFPLTAPVVTALLPEQGPGSGIRAVTNQGVQTYRMDPDQALSMLQSEEPGARLNGIKTLSVSAVPTQLEAILPYMSDEDGQIAYYAARAVGLMGGQAAAQEMVNLVEGEKIDIVLKLRALMALEMIADPLTVPTLAQAFSQDALARSSADALAAIGNDEAWSTLTMALADEALTPQRQAAMAAFEENGERALQPLIAQLSHESPTVRANAAEALGWMGNEAAIGPLHALLDDPEATVRARTAFAVGELRDIEGVTSLVRMSQNDPSPEVRTAAEQAAVQAQREPSVLDPARMAPVTPRNSLERLSDASLNWAKTLILTLTVLMAFLVLAARPRRRHATEEIRNR
ncbi:MAG: HEAT repeat domain-containing protein [Ardenticatenales bacterium]|nr:HEAT repeat domain-containing protein [Ardenticatenales bacterium]